jgi:hypothetical protein
MVCLVKCLFWQANEIDEAHLVQIQQSASTRSSDEDSGACNVSGEATQDGRSPNHDNPGISSHLSWFPIEPVHDVQDFGVTNGSSQTWLAFEHEFSGVGAWDMPGNDAGIPRAVGESSGLLLREPLLLLDGEEGQQKLDYALPSIRDNFIEELFSVSMGSYRNDQTLVGSETALEVNSATTIFIYHSQRTPEGPMLTAS